MRRLFATPRRGLSERRQDKSGLESGRPRPLVWFFDLDDTLHDASHAIFAMIDTRMTDFVERHLQLPRADADRLRRTYWRRYGATVLGLIRHHGIDPHHFLRETHDFDVDSRLRAEPGLHGLGRRLAGRKVLLSNSPAEYAGRVLRGLGVHRFIRTRYAVEQMRLHGDLRPKPAQSMLRAMLVREKVAGRSPTGRGILVDDSLANLRAARATGFVTVLIQREHEERRRRLAGAGYVHVRIRSLGRLPALAARLRACRR